MRARAFIAVSMAVAAVLVPGSWGNGGPATDAGGFGADETSPTGRPIHVDVTGAAGLGAFLHAGYLGPDNIEDPPALFAESMGPGACWLDADVDGWLDLFLANGLYQTHVERNAALDPHSMLFHNRGDGTFEDVTDAAGVGVRAMAMGCGAADYDNDGWPDLFVTVFGSPRLFHNVGGTFEDVTVEAGLFEESCGDFLCWSTSVSWFDPDLDGCLDLYLDHFTDWDPEGIGAGPGPGQLNKFFRGDCAGHFEEIGAEVGLANEAHDTWSSLAADFNRDGWPDLYACNDGDDNDLYINQGDGTFEKIKTAAYNYRSCMGSSIGDPDHDDDWEIAVTNYLGQMNGIYFARDGDFVDVGGKEPWSDALPWTGWAAHWYDINNDGHQDLMIFNSHTEDNGIIPESMPILAYENRGDGSFGIVRTALGADLAVDYAARGGAWGDYDNDGDVDVVVAEGGEQPTHLLRADLTGGNFLNIDVLGTAPTVTRDAIGARIRVDAPGLPPQFHEKLAGSGYMGSNDPRFHFGLGTAETADVEVRWPDGSVGSWEGLPANSFVRIAQGSADADVLDTFPIVHVSGPTSGRRHATLAFEADAVAGAGAAITSIVWDFGDGVQTTTGTAATASFTDIGGFAARATVTDTLGHKKSQAVGVTIFDDLVAEVHVDRPLILPTEQQSGEVMVHFADGAAVRGATLHVTITRGTGNDVGDAILGLAPGGLNEAQGRNVIRLVGTTDEEGRFTFEVPFNVMVEDPNDNLDPVEISQIGAYRVLVEGGARGSVFGPAETRYAVVVELPAVPSRG